MKKWISFILAVLMALTLTACDGGKAPVGSAEQENSPNPAISSGEDAGDASGADYSGVTAMPADEVEQFAALVKDAYLNEDWDWIAEHVRYPITVDGEELADAQALTAFLSERHVHPSDRTAMEEETCSGLFANGQGICLGSGQIWLLDPGYASDAEPKLEIIAISGVTKDS